MGSKGFLKGTLTIYTAAMSTTAASPTVPSSSVLSSEQLTVVVASFSSLALFVVIVVMLSVIYRRDPQCCKLRSYQASRSDMAAPPQYYSSRQTLVGTPGDQTHITDDNIQQAGQLFYVGLPSSYSLPTLEPPMPRLPSYESVRKKDRQRQIHMMIADRFGLNGSIVTEPPPSYEESIRQSVELPYNIYSSSTGLNIQSDTPQPVDCDTAGGVVPV